LCKWNLCTDCSSVHSVVKCREGRADTKVFCRNTCNFIKCLLRLNRHTLRLGATNRNGRTTYHTIDVAVETCRWCNRMVLSSLVVVLCRSDIHYFALPMRKRKLVLTWQHETKVVVQKLETCYKIPNPISCTFLIFFGQPVGCTKNNSRNNNNAFIDLPIICATGCPKNKKRAIYRVMDVDLHVSHLGNQLCFHVSKSLTLLVVSAK